MPKTVYIALGAKRDAETGNVFCAATLSYEGAETDYKARFTDILTRRIAQSETTVSGGFAYALRKALNRLTEPCIVRVRIGHATDELTRCMTAYCGALNKTAQKLAPINVAVYPELIRTINGRVSGGNIQIGREDDNPLVIEVNEMAESFKQDWLERTAHLRENKPKSQPQPSL